MLKLMVEGDERNQVHRRQGSTELLLSDERDLSVNAETVRALLGRELAEWVPSARFPEVQELKITEAGLAYASQRARKVSPGQQALQF
jgi:hypothetical protein